ncbi:MAG: ABC-F family ATP-binding cassette domain-containing protein [Pseudomonadota bacterium]|nr:ABC-F family ATP-binding cassette domain-containing protein [Pseudomonadota bacterium]
MAAPILFLNDIRLTFGGRPLLDGAGFQLHAGDRIGLVGRNGSGKSTLLRIAAGLVEPDSGERFLQPGITLRYLPQEPDLSGFETVLDYVESHLAPGDDSHRAGILLESLGLVGDEHPQTISGGEARRAALAGVLAPNPDILLLDEPTNHLDLPAIEWLEAELRAMRSALVLISHDRRFLSALSRRTVWLDRGGARTLEKGFDAFEAWRDEVLAEEEAEAHRLDRKIAREQDWIVHGVSARRKRNMRRVRELADLRRTRAEALKATGSVAFAAASSGKSGKLVARLDHVSKAYGSLQVVRDFSTIIHRGDRIGIVGPNGAGKTTLVRLITGELAPDSGEIRLGAGIAMLLIDQKRESLDPETPLKDAITGGGGDFLEVDGSRKHVASYMQDFLFSPEQAGTPVGALSGGERGRLMLARGLGKSSNLLVLDEPTNDLDLETLDLLQEFLADYAGTVLLVSHDRDFLDRICTSVVASDGDGVWREYAGGYSDMVAQKGSGVAARKAVRAGQASARRKTADREPTAAPQPSTPKLSFAQQHALKTLPGEIERLNGEIGKLRKALADPGLYEREPRKFETFARALAERETALAAREEEWLELEILREEAEG